MAGSTGSLALSGLASGVDTSSIVQQLLANDRARVSRMQWSQQAAQTQQGQLRGVASKLTNLLGARVDLANSGTHILTSDQFHLRANWEGPQPLGWLMRDNAAWWRSCQYVQTLAARTDATLVFGHDPDVLAELRGVRD